MYTTELAVFAAYFLFMLGIGIFFFFRSRGKGEKDYFLGGRNMGAWVSALSAGASDMSAWVLMGLPAAVYAAGMGKTWIAMGLGLGYAASWILEAPRLRRFSIAAGLLAAAAGSLLTKAPDKAVEALFLRAASSRE